MKWLDKNFLIFGCASKEAFDSVTEEREAFNHKVWRVASAIAAVYFLILFLTSFSLDFVAPNAVLYAVLMVLSAISSLLLFTVAKPGTRLLSAVIQLTCLALLAFGVIIGSSLSKDSLAVTFHVLLIGLPLIVIDKPLQMTLMELLVTICFLILTSLIKTGETRNIDMYNSVMFFVLAQLTNYYVVAMKLDQFLSTRKLETSSLTDELTGLNNRKAYEDDLQTYPSVPTEADFVYISMDVNELKIVNDSLGHDAGDELLKGAATCIKRCLCPYGKAYRVGGDEFTAIIFADEARLEEIKKDFEETFLTWCGDFVDHLSISAGYVSKCEFPDTTVLELAKLADKRMYADKSNHYRKKGVDRRGQQAAHTALCALYTKILKINLTEDSFHVVNMDLSEQTAEKGYSNKISEWLQGFGRSGHVHPDDLENYLARTDIDFLKEYFLSDKTSISIFYHRKMADGVYEEVVMEMIPANDYTPENQTLFLYVKAIDK